MTADQVLRFAIVKFCEELSYRKLADRVDDSIVLREFCRIPLGVVPRFTTLQDNMRPLKNWPQRLAETSSNGRRPPTSVWRGF
ncbi:MAG: transposase [Candidatus Hydrogenedentes bacterium]|nr:transposase [Candidatus Hydrogenedentota bacterium]